MTKEENRIGAGRPTEYTKDIFDVISTRISEGESLNRITEEEGFPTKTTFYRWLREHEELSSLYARAKEDRADTYADEMVDIADTAGATMQDIQKARLRVETRKWISCKLHPRNYGEKMALEHSGKNGGPIETINITQKEIRDLADKMREEKEE